MKSNILKIAALIFIFFLYLSDAQSQPGEGLNVGEKLPEITLNDIQGNPRNLSDLRGYVVFVDFWASWCQPCRRENPVIVNTYNDFSGADFKTAKGFRVFNVSLDTSKEDWINAIEKDNMHWDEHVSDLRGWRSPVARNFNVRSIPMNYLIDENGVIIGKNLRGHQLADALKKLLTGE